MVYEYRHQRDIYHIKMGSNVLVREQSILGTLSKIKIN